jgi:hypothetical protein
MAKRIGLLSSLVASAVVTLAAPSARAQTAHDCVQELLTNITPATNTWGSPCSITWGDPVTGTGYAANTNGACLYTQCLKRSDPTLTSALLTSWWGSASPSSPVYHDQIVAQNHFTHITDFALAQPGDVLVVKYTASGVDTGYSMILGLSEPVGWTEDNSAEIFLAEVYDSTRTPHGYTDTRWYADNGSHDWGVGHSYLYVEVDPVTGEILAHTWSTVLNGSYYTQEQRHMVLGRFVR